MADPAGAGDSAQLASGRRTEERLTSGRIYTIAWRGDEIIGIDPQDGSPGSLKQETQEAGNIREKSRCRSIGLYEYFHVMGYKFYFYLGK